MLRGRCHGMLLLLCVMAASACGGKSAGGKGGSGGGSGRGGSSGGAGTGGASGGAGSGGGSGSSGASGTSGAAGTGGNGGTTGVAGGGGSSGGGGASGTGGSTAGAGGRGGTGGASGTGAGGTGGGAGTRGGAGTTGAGGTGGSAIAGTTGGAGTGGAGNCTGTTSVSGTVYDPSGTLPLYNVSVYAPTTALTAVTEGVTCDRCGLLSGAPAAVATSDAQGKFKLEGIPAGVNVPIVFQTGKWRRQVTIPNVAACTDTPLTDANLTRLPRNKAEGHIPRIAVSTGAGDALECFLRRIGIDDAEFTPDTGNGRVHLYEGGGGTNSFVTGDAFSPATSLWSNPTKLATYDMIGFACEGSTSKYIDQKPQTSVDNVAAYANSGGRLFLTHLHFSWLQRAANFSGTTTFAVMDTLASPIVATVNQTSARGMALAQWLGGPSVNASTTLGQIQLAGSEHSVVSLDPAMTEWIYVPNSPPNNHTTQVLSFQTPLSMPAAQQCGKVLFADTHLQKADGTGGGDDSDPSKPFPYGCRTNAMTPQMKALEFLFFDLGACL